MNGSFEKIFRLVQKTGEKCIFYDSNSDDNYVILPLSEYERMVDNEDAVADLTQEQLLDKINRDIAMWKSGQEDEEREWLDDDFAYKNKANEENVSEEKFYLEPLE